MDFEYQYIRALDLRLSDQNFRRGGHRKNIRRVRIIQNDPETIAVFGHDACRQIENRDPELLVYVGQNAPFEAAVAGIHPYINHESLAYPVLHGGGIPAIKFGIVRSEDRAAHHRGENLAPRIPGVSLVSFLHLAGVVRKQQVVELDTGSDQVRDCRAVARLEQMPRPVLVS